MPGYQPLVWPATANLPCMRECSVLIVGNVIVPEIGTLPFHTRTSQWMAHMPTWFVRNVIQVEVLGDFQPIAQPATQNRPGITAQTVHPATAPVIGTPHSHIPTPVVAAALITIARPVPIATQAATILHQTVENVMTVTTQVADEELISSDPRRSYISIDWEN